MGNSTGGTLAAQIALQAPERIQILVLISPAIYQTGGKRGWLRPLLRLPLLEYFGLRFMRSSFPEVGKSMLELAWHNPTKRNTEIRVGYELLLQAENWDRGLWNFVMASEEPGNLIEDLAQSQVPFLVVSGDDDRVVPTKDNIRLAEEIGAQLELFEACGHVPQEECPNQFLSALNAFLHDLSTR